ncbi:hypothetical protein TNCV_1432631 [Trichonephila clavipes]|nr:hypothetical protein TNCV_1432631 [Trichonephila clavipes]
MTEGRHSILFEYAGLSPDQITRAAAQQIPSLRGHRSSLLLVLGVRLPRNYYHVCSKKKKPTPNIHLSNRPFKPPGNTSTYATPTYANLKLRDFQLSSIRLLFKRYTTRCVLLSTTETRAESVPEPDETGKVIEEVVNLSRQINLEADSDDAQELLDFHNQELTMNELLERHEQEQNIDELESLIQSEDRMTVGNLTEDLRLIEKGCASSSTLAISTLYSNWLRQYERVTQHKGTRTRSFLPTNSRLKVGKKERE